MKKIYHLFNGRSFKDDRCLLIASSHSNIDFYLRVEKVLKGHWCFELVSKNNSGLTEIATSDSWGVIMERAMLEIL